MQRKRGEVGEVFGGLDGPVKALAKTSPQALIPSPPTQRHFTRTDQVHQLVAASEADPDLGFMARTMALCSLPRSNPGGDLRWVSISTCGSPTAPSRFALRSGSPGRTSTGNLG